MVSRRGEAQHTQRAPERKRTLGSVDGPEQRGFQGAFGQSSSVEPDIKRSQECDQQPDYCSQRILTRRRSFRTSA